MISLNVESKKIHQLVNIRKKKTKTDSHREQSSGYQCRDGRRRDNIGVEN